MKNEFIRKPKVGEQVIVPSEEWWFNPYGIFSGYLGTVNSVRKNRNPKVTSNKIFITIYGLGKREFNWMWLCENQEKWAKELGIEKDIIDGKMIYVLKART